MFENFGVTLTILDNSRAKKSALTVGHSYCHPKIFQPRNESKQVYTRQPVFSEKVAMETPVLLPRKASKAMVISFHGFSVGVFENVSLIHKTWRFCFKCGPPHVNSFICRRKLCERPTCSGRTCILRAHLTCLGVSEKVKIISDVNGNEDWNLETCGERKLISSYLIS